MAYDSEIANKHDANINWPEEYQAALHPDYVFVHNEIEGINASPDKVFSWLTHGQTWVTFYDNAHKFHIIAPDNNNGVLQLGTRFNWTTFGVNIDSEVLVYEQDREIIWNGKTLGLDVCHAWKLYQQDDGCTRVVTEEIQHKAMAKVNSLFFPHRMYEKHQEWLVGLKTIAESKGYAVYEGK